MSAPAGTESKYARSDYAERQRAEKARAIATWCWAHGLDGPAVSGLDDAARRRVARTAGVNPPSTWATWAVAVAKLETAAQRTDMAGQFGTEERPEWAGTTNIDPSKNISSATPNRETRAAAADTVAGGSPEAGGIPALASREGELTAYGERLELKASRTAHPAGTRLPSSFDPPVLPQGWEELVASGLTLGHGRTCSISKCHAPAVAASMTVYRCKDHPPVRGEWGFRLDWAPRKHGSCAPNRCHCGSCPSHRLAMVPSIPTPRDDKKKGGRR